MNDFEKYFWNTKDRIIHKYTHYLEIYERHFSKFRGSPVNIVEVGIGHGGSLQMWKNYFGSNANIYGVDIVNRLHIEEPGIKIYIGDQSDVGFWDSFFNEVPHVDIFIDDGSHYSDQQIITFNTVFPKLPLNSVYLCEDLHTAYLEDFHGGYKKEGSFIEYMKELIDTTNAEVIPELRSQVKEISNIRRINFYCGVVVVEKADVSKVGECLYVGEVKA